METIKTSKIWWLFIPFYYLSLLIQIPCWLVAMIGEALVSVGSWSANWLHDEIALRILAKSQRPADKE
jgi:hypothetical protein